MNLLTNSRKGSQNGAALLTALIFLVILTLLGIGVFTTTTSEERMARNFRDKEIAMQGAEAALNEAKVLISGSYDNDPNGDGDTSDAPNPAPAALSEDKCYANTPTGYTCDPTIVLNVNSLDLYSGSTTGAPLGQVGTSYSPTIPGFYSSTQPRYLVIWQKNSVCGTSNTGSCFMIVAQARGRLANTRINLVELFTH